MLTDIAIPCVQLRVPRRLSLNDALNALNQVRRVYVPYWAGRLSAPDSFIDSADHRAPGQTPRYAWWVYKQTGGHGKSR